MSAHNKFTEREKKFKQRRKCGNVFKHKQNTFALMETTQPQMPRKNVKKNAISMRTFKMADIKFLKKYLKTNSKFFSLNRV